MEYRTISLEELRKAKFPPHDVILDEQERELRAHDLRSAMAYTNIEHDEVGLIIQLADGEQVEYMSDFIEFEGSLVELKGGYAIPVKSILKIAI